MDLDLPHGGQNDEYNGIGFAKISNIFVMHDAYLFGTEYLIKYSILPGVW